MEDNLFVESFIYIYIYIREFVHNIKIIHVLYYFFYTFMSCYIICIFYGTVYICIKTMFFQ